MAGRSEMRKAYNAAIVTHNPTAPKCVDVTTHYVWNGCEYTFLMDDGQSTKVLGTTEPIADIARRAAKQHAEGMW